MKIAVATYCLGYNYGAMLQAFATQKVLESLGHEVLFINQHQPWSLGLDEKDWRNYLSLHPKSIFYKWAKLLQQRKLRKCFMPMWEMFPFTKYYGYDVKNIIDDPPKCDCYITGSDQTWNTSAHREHFAIYFLPFGDRSVKRIAYAPSLGGTKFKETDRQWILSQLCSYSAISVREKQDVDYLTSLGVKNVKQMPDPTLTVEKKVYDDFIQSENHHIFDATVYILGGANKELSSTIPHILKINNLNISNVLNITLQDFKCASAINKPTTVQKWVDSIAHSNVVITNSFHAVVFSLIYNRPFIYIKFQGSEDSKNGRVHSLLGGTPQEFRMVDFHNITSLSPFLVVPNFDSKLQDLRTKGINFLINNI